MPDEPGDEREGCVTAPLAPFAGWAKRLDGAFSSWLRAPLAGAHEDPSVRAIGIAVIVCLCGAFLFSCSPVLLFPRSHTYADLYAKKAERPFANLVVEDAPGGHENKINPRLGGALVTHLAWRAGLSLYVPPAIGGIFLFACVFVCASRILSDWTAGLYSALLCAGLYPASQCFHWNGTIYDGIALGFLALGCVSLRKPPLVGAFLFVACWTDERAAIASAAIALLASSHPRLEVRQKRWAIAGVVLAVAAFVVSRVVVVRLLGLEVSYDKVGLSVLPATDTYIPLGALVAFEGGWLLVTLHAYLLMTAKERMCAGLFLVLVAGGVFACFLVLDISRTTAFLFPLLLVSLTRLDRSFERAQVRGLVGAAATVSLLIGNMKIIAGGSTLWTVPAPVALVALLLKQLGFDFWRG